METAPQTHCVSGILIGIPGRAVPGAPVLGEGGGDSGGTVDICSGYLDECIDPREEHEAAGEGQGDDGGEGHDIVW